MEITSFVLSIIAFVLSSINYAKDWSKDRVKIKVIPQWALTATKTTLAIKIINLGYYEIVIDEISLKLKGNMKLHFVDKPFYSRVELPIKLKPRHSYMAILHPDILTFEQREDIKCAIVGTACGKIFKGKNAVLKQIVSGDIEHIIKVNRKNDNEQI